MVASGHRGSHRPGSGTKRRTRPSFPKPDFERGFSTGARTHLYERDIRPARKVGVARERAPEFPPIEIERLYATNALWVADIHSSDQVRVAANFQSQRALQHTARTFRSCHPEFEFRRFRHGSNHFPGACARLDYKRVWQIGVLVQVSGHATGAVAGNLGLASVAIPEVSLGDGLRNRRHSHHLQPIGTNPEAPVADLCRERGQTGVRDPYSCQVAALDDEEVVPCPLDLCKWERRHFLSLCEFGTLLATSAAKSLKESSRHSSRLGAGGRRSCIDTLRIRASMPNPLTEIQFEVPFEDIRAEHVEPAIDQLLEEARLSLESLVATDEGPTYANTLAALEDLGEKLGYAMGVVGHLEGVATYAELRAAYNAVQPRVSEFFSAIPLNEGVWKRIRAFSDSTEVAGLSPTRKRFLDKTLDDFRRSGAELGPSEKKRLLEINVELAKITTKYAENVLDATNAFDLIIEDEEGLAGLPRTAVAAAKESAERKGKAGWRFTLQAPSFMAVMTYLDDEAIRERMYRAFSSRAARGEFDNRENIARILALRKEMARLLGYSDFADLVLEDRMAKSGAKAWKFVDDLRQRTQAAFDIENEDLDEFSGSKVKPWDLAYQAEKLRRAQYNFDEEDLRPYFPYEGVLRGMFEIAQRLFGLEIRKWEGVPVWDAGVDAYEVNDADGSHLGSFYADYFPRENKRGGAWMDSLITGQPSAIGFTPHLGFNCGNLTPPTEGKPALLTHREVETIFHEFGHLLHHLLSRVEVRSLAGTNVAWDWVELPSQIMENWCWEREALDLFARHYETGKPIPEDLFAKMKRAKNFRSANAQMRQLGFGTLDLALHTRFDPDVNSDTVSYARDILQRHAPVDLPADNAMVASFTHLFSSPVGYGAGYYSYKWSEMLDADAFTRFAREGIFNPETGNSYRRNILERGNSAEPEDLFRQFMGRDPDAEALLRRLGLAA